MPDHVEVASLDSQSFWNRNNHCRLGQLYLDRRARVPSYLIIHQLLPVQSCVKE